MNIQYLKEQFIPKSKKLKIIYGTLWVLEPVLMAGIVAIILIKNRKKVITP